MIFNAIYLNEFITEEISSSKSFQGKNLTGTVRLIRDLTADIHANIQQWNNFHIQGITYLKDITEKKHNNNYSDILQDLCDKLENVCDNLVNFFFFLKHILSFIFYFYNFMYIEHFGS